jgi:hypothetical protein
MTPIKDGDAMSVEEFRIADGGRRKYGGLSTSLFTMRLCIASFEMTPLLQG